MLTKFCCEFKAVKVAVLGLYIVGCCISWLVWQQSGWSFRRSREFFYVDESDLLYGFKLSSTNTGDSKLIFNNLDKDHEIKLSGCPDYNCKISGLTSKLAGAATVTQTPIYDKEFQQSMGIQLLVDQESPQNRHQNHLDEKSIGWFNYHRTSSIWSPYGYILKLRSRIAIPHAKMMEERRHLVAWFVSNCVTKSKRELYVKELSKYIPVDIRGSCSNKTCLINDCYSMLDQSYKFYLAFENSMCDDYVTEKFWHSIHKYVVPIVLKRSIVAPFAPVKSFIAADDFQSPRELANYLLYLNETPQAYVEHHRWREHFRPIQLRGGNANDGIYGRPFGFCQLCRKLWQNTESDWVESYQNSRETKAAGYCYDINTSDFTISSLGQTIAETGKS